MGDLRGGMPQQNSKSMFLLANGPWLIMVVIGLVILGYSLLRGETGMPLQWVDGVQISVMATGENIPMTDDEVAEFKELFNKKAMYKRTEKDAPFNDYDVILTIHQTPEEGQTAADVTMYVSVDRVELTVNGEQYTTRLIPDQWTGLKGILMAHGVTL